VFLRDTRTRANCIVSSMHNESSSAVVSAVHAASSSGAGVARPGQCRNCLLIPRRGYSPILVGMAVCSFLAALAMVWLGHADDEPRGLLMICKRLTHHEPAYAHSR